MSCSPPTRDTLLRYVEARDAGLPTAPRLESRALWEHEDVAISAARRRSSSVPMDERVQAARIGLLKAMRSWKPDGGASLKTWAARPMLEALAEAELEASPVVIPRTQLRRRRAALDAMESLRSEGSEPSTAEIAERCGLSVGVVTRLLAAPVEREGADSPSGVCGQLVSTWSETDLDFGRAIEHALTVDRRGTVVVLESVVLGKTFKEIGADQSRSRQLMARHASGGEAALRDYTAPRNPALGTDFARMSASLVDEKASASAPAPREPAVQLEIAAFAVTPIETPKPEPARAPIIVLPFSRARPWPTITSPARPTLGARCPTIPLPPWRGRDAHRRSDARISTSPSSPASGTGLGRGPPKDSGSHSTFVL